MQSVESRRRNQTRYIRAVRQIRRSKRRTWREARTVYRDGIAALGLKHRPKRGVPVGAIIRASDQPAIFLVTSWVNLSDNIYANMDEGKTITVDFREWDLPEMDVPRGRVMRTYRNIRNAGDKFFENNEAYKSLEEKSTKHWTDYWRVLEDIGVLLYPGRVEYFWADDYTPWEKPQKNIALNIVGGK